MILFLHDVEKCNFYKSTRVGIDLFLQIQFLHCIKQFEGIGGDNEFVDSFAVASHIKENYPMEWQALTQMKCAFSDLGYDEISDSTFYKIHYSPIFK